MEFQLLPAHRVTYPTEALKTPYVCRERYDGGPWLSYPARKGKAAKFKEGPFDLLDYSRSERVDPTPINEQESLFQTWLYFGLAEFIGANSIEPSVDAASDELIQQIYDIILIKNGSQTYVTLDAARLEKLLEMGRARISPDPQVRRKHYEHMITCLQYAQPLITTVPDNFNRRIKWSMAALGELFTVTVQAALEVFQALPKDSGMPWATGFLHEGAKTSMREHGWCRSDIARAEAKYQSVQTLYIASMLDKSLPYRDHSKCTDSACNSYQINLGQYESQHQSSPCSCEELEIEEERLLPPLLDGNHYPLLKFEGGLDDLACEIVKSGKKPYLAISHVWADGLGNPHANSLHKCKLHHLRSLVDAINDKESETAQNPGERCLIWLDTLCCPAKEGEQKGKQKSIEKIRLVYQKAKHVLVLDAGLMSYDSQGQDAPEILFRIFTSSWMRRLWTLQEGALASSLYFQFADSAVRLLDVLKQAWSMTTSMQYRALQPDLVRETTGIWAFFNYSKPLSFGDAFDALDRALQYRSVSVASDEPLCIGTLMSLDLPAIVKIETQESRMEKVWELISAKYKGVPSQVIFLEEPKITQPGWRWAPKSLLNSQTVLQAFNTRLLRWFDPHLASREDAHGLQVKYPGVRISFRSDYGDGKPRNPWIGAPRLPENWLQYRSLEDGRWYRIIDQKLAALNKSWTDEERQEYQAQGLFPLHVVANTGKGFLVINNLPNVQVQEALFTTSVSKEDIDAVANSPIAVTTQLYAVLSDLKEESYIHDVVEKVALEVRADEVTDRHLELCEKLHIDSHTSSDVFKSLLADHEDFIASTARVKNKIKEKLAQVALDDAKFVTLIDKYWGESFRESLWVVIRDFFHHDLVGKRTRDEQVWFVD